MRLFYGSRAMFYWFKDSRLPNDLDIISPNVEENKGKSTEHKQYYWTEAFEYLREHNKDENYVDPDLLYTIKVSHAAWDINWEKTMKDIKFLKSKGCKLNLEFYHLLYADWEKLHGKKKVKMNVKNEDFFKENIHRKYDHEWLHEQFAFTDRPMNERIREDLDSPLCSEKLWNEMEYPDKLRTALEEIFVLTAERYIFVQNPLPTKTARLKMLKQMITSTTSGWFNRFLIEHFDSLRILSEDYFIKKISYIKENYE